jgi:hypothetical protein
MFIKNPQFFGIDPKRKVMYRNFHEISGVVYLCEISRNEKKIFVLLFPNFEKPDIFICEFLNEKIFQKLLGDNAYAYDHLIENNFIIKFGKLLIKSYNHGQEDPRTKKSLGIGSQITSEITFSQKLSPKCELIKLVEPEGGEFGQMEKYSRIPELPDEQRTKHSQVKSDIKKEAPNILITPEPSSEVHLDKAFSLDNLEDE